MWAVIPVKRLELSKQRLAGVLSAAQRANLMRAMLEDVLAVLAEVQGLSGRLIVTSEPGIQALAERYGAQVLTELADNDTDLRGQNISSTTGTARPAQHQSASGPPPQDQLCRALEQAVRHLQTFDARGMLVIPGDVPLIVGAEVEQLIARHQAHCVDQAGVTIVPDHDCGGTNALLVSPPGRIEFRFGFDSCRRHEQAAADAGVRGQVVRLQGFELDVDNAEDLRELSKRGVGTRAHAVLLAMNVTNGAKEAHATSPAS